MNYFVAIRKGSNQYSFVGLVHFEGGVQAMQIG